MKKRIALFRSISLNYITPCTERLASDDYIQITEWEDVDFTLLPESDVINAQIRSIDFEIERVKSNTIYLLKELQTKKQELLSLEHQNEANLDAKTDNLP